MVTIFILIITDLGEDKGQRKGESRESAAGPLTLNPLPSPKFVIISHSFLLTYIFV